MARVEGPDVGADGHLFLNPLVVVSYIKLTTRLEHRLAATPQQIYKCRQLLQLFLEGQDAAGTARGQKLVVRPLNGSGFRGLERKDKVTVRGLVQNSGDMTAVTLTDGHSFLCER